MLILPDKPVHSGTGIVPASSASSVLARLVASLRDVESLVVMQAVVSLWYQVREQSTETVESKP